LSVGRFWLKFLYPLGNASAFVGQRWRIFAIASASRLVSIVFFRAAWRIFAKVIIDQSTPHRFMASARR
jgi:hypothetical protein